MTPERPESVPAAAEWNPAENEWELGPKNEEGEPVGDWQWWAPEGYLVCRASYDDQGRLHGLLERWHANGERAQWANWVHGKTHGVQVWTLATEGPSDKNSYLPPNIPDNVKRMDLPYFHGEAQTYHFTLYYDSALEDPVPTDDSGRSVELGDHLHKVAPDSTFLLVEETFETTDSDEIGWPENTDARWVYQGPVEGGFGVRLVDGYEKTDFVVSKEEMTRAFTLSADYYISWRESMRPDSLPDQAIWSIRESMWTLGETVDDKPRGEWKWWDEAGTLRRRASYSRFGALNGEFERWHPDGTIATRGQYNNGAEVGVWTSWASHEPTNHGLSAGENVWRVEHDKDEDSFRYFTEDGTETNRHGVPLDEAHEDEFWLARSPETFIDDGFHQFLERLDEPQPEESLDRYDQLFEETWGFPPAPQLSKLAGSIRDNGNSFLFEWRTDLYPDVAPDLDEIETENLFERLVLFGQEGYLDTSLQEVFSGLALVGTLGNGDSYMVSVVESQADDIENGQVYFFSHEEMFCDTPIASDLSHLAYASCLAAARDDLEAISDDAFRTCWQKLDGEFAPSWHWSGMMEAGANAEFELLQPEQETSRYYFWCSLWIIDLLRQFEDVEDVEVNPDYWLEPEGTPQEVLEKATRLVPMGLNLLWRSFFFDEEDRLVELMEACASSKSRILRDAVSLIERFRAGEPQLGEIEDIYELRDQFLGMSLHPEEVESRLAEEAEAEKRAIEAASIARERVAEMTAAREDLTEPFWSSWDDPALQDAITEHWRKEPEFSTFLQALQDSAKNAGGFGTYEIDDARRWIAEHPDPRYTGILVAGMRDRSLVGYRDVLSLLDWSPGFEPIIELLYVDEEFHHIHMAVAETLGKHRVAEGTDAIIHALDEASKEEGYRVAKEFEAAALLALGRIGGETAVAYLRDSLESQKFPLPALAPALAELDTSEFVAPLAESLENAAPRPLLWALARMAAHADEASAKVALEALEAIADKHLVIMMLARHAAHAYGGDFADLRRWVRSALAPETNPYSSDEGAEQVIWALRVAAEHEELEPEIILDWIHHDVVEVAHAARAAAEARSLDYEVRQLDRWQADELYEQGGVEALHEALADPALSYPHAAASKIAEVGDSTSASVVADRIESFVPQWKEISSGGDTPKILAGLFNVLRSLDNSAELVRASLACFGHGHSKIVDPVLREEIPGDERLLEHMFRTEGLMTGWKQSAATEWLEAYPDQEAVAALRG